MVEGEPDADMSDGGVLGHVIPRRRYTRWAAWYFLLYVCLPVLTLGALVDALLYFVVTAMLGRCYALFCLFG